MLSLQSPGDAESGVILYYETGESHLDVVHTSAHGTPCVAVSMLSFSAHIL